MICAATCDEGSDVAARSLFCSSDEDEAEDGGAEEAESNTDPATMNEIFSLMCTRDMEHGGQYCGDVFEELERSGLIQDTPAETWSAGDLCDTDLCELDSSQALLGMGCCLKTLVYIAKKYPDLNVDDPASTPTLMRWAARCMDVEAGELEVCPDPLVPYDTRMVFAEARRAGRLCRHRRLWWRSGPGGRGCGWGGTGRVLARPTCAAGPPLASPVSDPPPTVSQGHRFHAPLRACFAGSPLASLLCSPVTGIPVVAQQSHTACPNPWTLLPRSWPAMRARTWTWPRRSGRSRRRSRRTCRPASPCAGWSWFRWFSRAESFSRGKSRSFLCSPTGGEVWGCRGACDEGEDPENLLLVSLAVSAPKSEAGALRKRLAAAKQSIQAVGAEATLEAEGGLPEVSAALAVLVALA